MKKLNHSFILFWLSQSISQLGSSMTSFALIIWAYTKTESAMTVSLMSFCSYLPYVLVSLLAGDFVDHHTKKRIMLISDFGAALCSLSVLVLWYKGLLRIEYIYIINSIIGLMNAFQSPAETIAVRLLVPKEKWIQASGMNSMTMQLTLIAAPMLAPVIMTAGGLGSVIAVDLGSFLIAFLILLCGIHIPEKINKEKQRQGVLYGWWQGFRFLYQEKGLWQIVLTMAMMNFVSRLTYENILSPMILARSHHNMAVLGWVQGILGAGGIVGGLFLSISKRKMEPVKMIYLSAALSFFGGDLMMAIGQNGLVWCLAGLFASMPIPFVLAGQQVLLYEKIPKEIQGKVFALRNAIQFSTIPIGILIGGFLADHVFEPLMTLDSSISTLLGQIVGTGKGSGMAVMFLITGMTGGSYSILAYHSKEIQALRRGDEEKNEITGCSG